MEEDNKLDLILAGIEDLRREVAESTKFRYGRSRSLRNMASKDGRTSPTDRSRRKTA